MIDASSKCYKDPEDGPGLAVGLDYGEAQVPGGEAQLLGVYPPCLPVPGKEQICLNLSMIWIPVNVALGSVLIHGVATGAGGGGLGAGALGGVPEPAGPEVVPVPTCQRSNEERATLKFKIR